METLADYVEDTAVARENIPMTLEMWVVTADPDEGTAYRRVLVVLPEAPSNVASSVESDNLDSPERSTMLSYATKTRVRCRAKQQL